MRLLGKNKLQKLKAKNLGNKMLCAEIDKLISDFDQNDWKDEFALKEVRKDADCIHNDGFYFFDIAVHRAMILIEFDDDGEATVVWAGNHQDYERTFKNNKKSIESWLKSHNYI